LQVSGPAITLSSTSDASITFTAPDVDANTAISFSVTVVKDTETVTETASFNITNKTDSEAKPEDKKSSSGGSLYYLFTMLIGLSIFRRYQK